MTYCKYDSTAYYQYFPMSDWAQLPVSTEREQSECRQSQPFILLREPTVKPHTITSIQDSDGNALKDWETLFKSTYT